jgi:hypothetical protein
MTKITVALMIFLALVGAIYSVDRTLKRNYVGGNRYLFVAKWVTIAYLPIVFWLPVSISIFAPLLNEWIWFMITYFIGIAWATGVFVTFRKKYPR